MTTLTAKPHAIIPRQVNPVGAAKLAAWLYKMHPKIFNQLLQQAQSKERASAKGAAIGAAAKLSGLGCPGCAGNCGGVCPACAGKVVSMGAYRARKRPLGSLGFSLTDLTSGLTSSLSSIGSDVSSALSPSAISSSVSSGSGSSGGFWSSLGSDLSSAGSSVLSGVSSVGSFLTTGGGLGALTGLANDYFSAKSQSTVANAQAAQQQAILQAQTQAVAMGGVPSPISYTTNALGQQVPVYASATGYQPVTSSYLSSMFSGTSSYLPWLIGGGLAIFVIAKVL